MKLLLGFVLGLVVGTTGHRDGSELGALEI